MRITQAVPLRTFFLSDIESIAICNGAAIKI